MQASKLKVPLVGLALLALALGLRWIAGDRTEPPPPQPEVVADAGIAADDHPPPAAPPPGEGVLVPPKEKPAPAIVKAPPPKPLEVPKEVPIPLVGLGVAEVTKEERERQKLPDKVVGVMITAVDPASQAAEARLAPGDVIYEAQGVKVVDESSLRAGVGTREHTVIRAYRNGSRIAVVLHAPFKGD